MRTDNKYRIIGGLAGAGLGGAVSIAYQNAKLKQNGEELTWKNLNGWQVLLWTIIGSIIGTHVGNVLYNLKAFHDENPNFSAGGFLGTLLKEESIKSDPAHFNLVVKHRQEVKDALSSLYQSKLADAPQDAGSFKNRTAILSDYDVDIILPFKKNAFVSLASMHSSVYRKMHKAFGHKASVVKNKKTIGVTFHVRDHEIHFDIAPGREIDNFKKDGKLNMYVSPDWVWQNGSSLKIDVDKQQRLTVNNPEAREIIRLLKIYSLRNNLNIPPVIISQLTVKALKPSKYGGVYSKNENLLNAMYYLASKLSLNNVRDLSNSNNNLLDKMSEEERFSASELMLSDIKKIEKDPGYLKEVFKE
jgi:hypothetical protein